MNTTFRAKCLKQILKCRVCLAVHLSVCLSAGKPIPGAAVSAGFVHNSAESEERGSGWPEPSSARCGNTKLIKRLRWSARQREAVFSLYQNHCQSFAFARHSSSKANWVSALQGALSACRRWAAANTFPFKAHSVAFFTPQLSPWLLFSKSKSPRLFFSISHYSVSALSSQPFSNVQLKRKMFHFRPNPPFPLPFPSLLLRPPPSPFLWKKNKVIQIRKLRNSMYTFHWDLNPYWFGMI